MKTVFTLFLLTILLLTQSQIDSLTRFFPAVDWEKQLIMLHFEIEGDEMVEREQDENLKKLESRLLRELSRNHIDRMRRESSDSLY